MSKVDQKVIFTIGHETLTKADFTRLLDEARVSMIYDIRLDPRLRSDELEQPDFALGMLPFWVGRDLRWKPSMSGSSFEESEEVAQARKAQVADGEFTQFSRWAQSEEYLYVLDTVEQEARRNRVVLMCSETDPRNCYRFEIAHLLQRRGWEIEHLGPRGTEYHQHMSPPVTSAGTDRVHALEAVAPSGEEHG